MIENCQHYNLAVLPSSVTAYNADVLEAQLIELLEIGDGLSLNLCGVQEIDSTGSQMLLNIKHAGQQQGKPVTLTKLWPHCCEAA